MTSQLQSAFWVTHEAHRRLTDELAELKSREVSLESGRRDVDEAQTTQQQLQDVQARQMRLDALLSRAVVGATCPDDGVVEPGMVVTARFEGDAEDETFLLGPRELLEYDPSVSMDVYSVESPLGTALLNSSRGDRVSYRTPQGAEVVVHVVDARPFGS